MTRLATVLVGVLLATSRLAAQDVGHDPTHSPYHDIPHGGGPLFTVGYVSGSRGEEGVGPSSGMGWGVRWDARLGGITTRVANLAYPQTHPFQANPSDSL